MRRALPPGLVPRRSYRRLVLLTGLAALVLLPGCGQGSFVGSRYNNFRAYYNTFYNARQSFEQGEEQLIRPDQRVDRSRFIPVFTTQVAETGRTGNTGPFQDAIDKSADLLRERPDSKWADDALLLIGKAYFYQANYVGAEAKFNETIDAAETNGQEDLADEARFWLGRTLAASERFDEATGVLTDGLAREQLRPFWRARLQLTLGEMYVQQRRWDDAAEALQAGIADLRDNDIAARAQFLLGQVLEAAERFPEAAQAYADVKRFRPVYELAYAAELNQALVLGLDAGQPDDGLAIITRMRRDDKHFQNRAEVELAYARLLAAAGRPDDARERFEALLYDEAFLRANVPRGETYLHYGTFYREIRGDYIRAAAYYDTAATSLRSEPGREELVTRAALTGVRQQAEVFRSYADIATQLAEADSLLYLGSLDEEDFRQAIAAIEVERRRIWLEEQRELNERRAESGFGGDSQVAGLGLPAGGRDDTPGANAVPGLDAGFLNYRNPARVQDALVFFQRTWRDRPLVPNWRRQEAIGAAALAESGAVGGPGEVSGTQGLGGPPPLDLSPIPRTEAARADLRLARADLRYELGNVLFLSLAQPDSAAFWYRRVIDEDADAPVSMRARYALAELLREQGQIQEATPLYQQVMEEAEGLPLGAQARERLGLPPLESDTQTDSLALAQEAYAEAYAAWQAEAFPDAFAGMMTLAERYPAQDVAPRALLAAASVYLDWAVRDTLDLLADFPQALIPPTLASAMADLPADAIGTPGPGAEPGAGREASGLGEEALEEDRLLQQRRDEGDDPRLADERIDERLAEEAIDEPEARALNRPAQPAGGPPQVASVEPDIAAVEPDDVPQPMNEATSDEQALVDPAAAMASDSTMAADSTVVSDSTEVGPRLSLAHVYALIEQRYPDTPYAEQAAQRRRAWLAAQAPDDPAEETEPDTAPEPVAAPVDPVRFPGAADPDAALAPELVAQMPLGTFGVGDGRPLSTSVGGYTWRVATLPNALAARAQLGNFLRRDLRAAAFEEEGPNGLQYVLIIGQFASVADAEEARGQLPRTGVSDPYVIEMTAQTLLSEAQLQERGGRGGRNVE